VRIFLSKRSILIGSATLLEIAGKSGAVAFSIVDNQSIDENQRFDSQVFAIAPLANIDCFLQYICVTDD
jgi:hypothetical protein